MTQNEFSQAYFIATTSDKKLPVCKALYPPTRRFTDDEFGRVDCTIEEMAEFIQANCRRIAITFDADNLVDISNFKRKFNIVETK